MSLSKRSEHMEVDGRIGLAIDNAVAASRWRIAARFEGRETAARFRRQAEHRSAAATAILNEVTRTVGVQSDSPRLARNDTGGLENRPSQSE